jgi:transcriptional regulator with XRE-family HTH domain
MSVTAASIERFSDTGEHRRSELADFLRKKREALTPEAAGLPPTRRRRTPGLRREEVAEIAGISASLYAWLEQARAVPISRRTTDALADALQLEPHERRHLHDLARPETIDLRESPTPRLERFVASLGATPAFVLDHTWNILQINAAAEAVYGKDGDEDEAPNMLRHVFLKQRFRELIPDWVEAAASVAEMFRLDYGGHGDDPAMRALVDELRAVSPEFERIWQRHNVRRDFPASHVVDHCSLGRLTFEPSMFGIVESPGLRLLAFAPIDDATRDRIVSHLVPSTSAG